MAQRKSENRGGGIGLVAVAVIAAGAILYFGWGGEKPSPLPELPVVILPADAELDDEVAAEIARFVEAARLAPGKAESHADLGLIYEANQLWDEALRCFDNAHTLDPDTPEYSSHAAQALQMLGRVDDAIARLREATQRAPEFAPGLHRLGVLLLGKGALDEAEKGFARTVELRPLLPHGYVGRGKVAVRKRDYEKAREHLVHALEIDEDDKEAHYALGQALRGLGKMDEARRELQRGRDAEPRYISDALAVRGARAATGLAAQFSRAQALLQAGRRADAINVLEDLRRRYPSDMRVVNNLAVAYHHASRFQEELALIQLALEKEPDSLPLHVNLASCYFRLGRPQDSLLAATAATAIADDSGKAHYVRGHALNALQRYPEAYQELRRSVSLDPKNGVALQELGELCSRLSRFAEASEHFEAAIALSPKSLPAHVNLGVISLTLGNRKRAGQALDEARALAPDHPRVQRLAELVAQYDAQQTKPPAPSPSPAPDDAPGAGGGG